MLTLPFFFEIAKIALHRHWSFYSRVLPTDCAKACTPGPGAPQAGSQIAPDGPEPGADGDQTPGGIPAAAGPRNRGSGDPDGEAQPPGSHPEGS